jgi:pyruvate kinase
MTTKRRTKIVATLGPATWDDDMLEALLNAGADVVRINCSHSNHDAIRRQVARIRRAAMRSNKRVGILLDLQGPKIRTGPVPDAIDLKVGDHLVIAMDDELVGEGLRVGTTYPAMADDVNAGDDVLFDDGALQGVVEAVHRDKNPKEVVVRMTVSGPLMSHKGINLPGVDMSVPSMTEKDRGDLAVGADIGVDYVALSFVRSAKDVEVLRAEMAKLGVEIPVIAKIEKPEAVENIDEILAVVEGIMVARGDLGVEIRIERVPVVQKELIQSAHKAGKLVITATQMLDSMIRNPRPTRAETTDVANAILDGTDAVMLSGETATGSYPLESVRMMDSIAREVEKSRFFISTPIAEIPAPDGVASVVIRSACWAANEDERALVVFTWSGKSALVASKARPHGPIYAFACNGGVLDQLALAWGVTPLELPDLRSVDDLIAAGVKELKRRKLVSTGDKLVIVAGSSPVVGATDLMKLELVGEDI